MRPFEFVIPILFLPFFTSPPQTSLCKLSGAETDDKVLGIRSALSVIFFVELSWRYSHNWSSLRSRFFYCLLHCLPRFSRDISQHPSKIPTCKSSPGWLESPLFTLQLYPSIIISQTFHVLSPLLFSITKSFSPELGPSWLDPLQFDPPELDSELRFLVFIPKILLFPLPSQNLDFLY